MSPSRTQAERRSATGFRSSSPAAWPEGVVDGLEAVEVDEDHGQPVAVAAGLGEGDAEAVVEEAPVGQAGQGVAVGERGHVLLGALAVGDVPHHDLDRGLARRRRRGRSAISASIDGPVAPEQPLLGEPGAVPSRSAAWIRSASASCRSGSTTSSSEAALQAVGIGGAQEPGEGALAKTIRPPATRRCPSGLPSTSER